MPSGEILVADTKVVNQPLQHDSAHKHVRGAANYIDDIPEPPGTLHVAVGQAPAARGRIATLDLDAVRAAPGVVAVLTAADIPGKNDISAAHRGDDPLFADGIVEFHGQAVFAVVATTRQAARKAARLGRIEIAAEPPLVTAEQAMAAASRLMDDYQFVRGDVDATIAAAPHRIEGRLQVGGQEHFYLEGQIALAIPGEDNDLHILSSTQHPTEIQHVAALVLDLQAARVTVECRRMGGAFGGKESQCTQWAVLAALAAHVTRRPCKVRLDRDDDFVLTGKRHDMVAEYSAGFDANGVLTGVSQRFLMRCGFSVDMSVGVCDRAMFHADNAYYMPDVRILSHRLKTNTVSNTAFRGFGGPQGMMSIERVMDEIAWATGLDPLDVRKRNLYAPGRDVTPYHQQVTDNILPEMLARLEATSDYRARRTEIAAFNAASPILKRGLALTPLKFGISFTLMHLNQAGALVHIYQDGSVHLNHGGTEMGQGLNTKVAQVVAEVFGIGLDRVRITSTNTDKVPNTTPTAASAGSDLNGMAAKNAAETIKARLVEFAAETWKTPPDTVRFGDGMVIVGNETISFGELAKRAHLARVSLSSTGFYKTPDIHWDRANARGKPFYYFCYGAACSEVIVDTLTGEAKVTRVDVLHDVGRSLNPIIDRGQIEGGFAQGMGWLTTEELVFDSAGRLRTHAPSTYKIPTAADVPPDFRLAFWDGPNKAETVYRSKAVGEPPLMLAISVFCAVGDAIHSLAPGKPVALSAPATPEAILNAVAHARGEG